MINQDLPTNILDHQNNSYLGISNNPSSCQRSNSRFNSATFNERIQSFIRNNPDASGQVIKIFENCNDSIDNPFDHPVVINPSDIGAGYDSKPGNQT